MATKSAGELYEELRRKKLEENRRKLEDLNLQHLSFSLREAAAAGASPKPSPAKKKRKPAEEEGSAVLKRRSSRIANLPEQSYKEVNVFAEIVERPRKMFRSSKHRDLSGRVYASDEAREYAIDKAEELEKDLGTDYPSFVKPMLQSHTTGGFWLGLPTGFCTKYLPKHDSTMVLVDENGDESNTTYLAHKRGLSAGWRGFSIDHGLVDGDALVFQLINQITFKVYIIRGNDYYSS